MKVLDNSQLPFAQIYKIDIYMFNKILQATVY